MIRSLGVAVFAISTLSACASIDSMTEYLFGPEMATGSAAAGSTAMPPLPRRKPETVTGVTLAAADPQQLVGLDFDDTKALLGDPAARIDQAPAKVWAYAGGGCRFSVFFYPSVNDQVFRVLAIEVTGESTVADSSGEPDARSTSAKVMNRDDPQVRRCFADLLQDQRDRDAG